MQQELLGYGLELPDVEFDATPHSDRCARCDGGENLRFVILRVRSGYAGVALCGGCAEELLEATAGS